MQTRWITVHIVQVRQHRLRDFRLKWSCRVEIEVNTARHDATLLFHPDFRRRLTELRDFDYVIAVRRYVKPMSKFAVRAFFLACRPEYAYRELVEIFSRLCRGSFWVAANTLIGWCKVMRFIALRSLRSWGATLAV